MATTIDFRKYLEDNYELAWINGWDNEGVPAGIAEAMVRERSYEPLYDSPDMEWVDNMRGEEVFHEFTRIKSKMIGDGVATEEEIDAIQDEIEEEIYARDKSDVWEDLVKHTQMTFFISLGEEVEEPWSLSDEELEKEVAQFMDYFDTKYPKTEKGLRKLFSNGGGLVRIYFTAYLGELMKPGLKSIKLDGLVSMGAVNPYEGSGDVEEVYFDNVRIPLERKNIFSDAAEKWGWSDIAGCSDGWAREVEFLEEPCDKEIASAPEAGIKEREEEYNRRFREGGCTFGDMDMKRHRHIEYENSFPCGWRCKDCGTFWID